MRGNPLYCLPIVVLGCLACDIPATTSSLPLSSPEFPARVYVFPPASMSEEASLNEGAVLLEDPCAAPETLDFVIEGYGRNTVGGWPPLTSRQGL